MAFLNFVCIYKHIQKNVKHSKEHLFKMQFTLFIILIEDFEFTMNFS